MDKVVQQIRRSDSVIIPKYRRQRLARSQGNEPLCRRAASGAMSDGISYDTLASIVISIGKHAPVISEFQSPTLLSSIARAAGRDVGEYHRGHTRRISRRTCAEVYPNGHAEIQLVALCAASASTYMEGNKRDRARRSVPIAVAAENPMLRR